MWYSWRCYAVKIFLMFSWSVPVRHTEVHSAYPEWLVGRHVLVCLWHDYIASNEFEDEFCMWQFQSCLGQYLFIYKVLFNSRLKLFFFLKIASAMTVQLFKLNLGPIYFPQCYMKRTIFIRYCISPTMCTVCLWEKRPTPMQVCLGSWQHAHHIQRFIKLP